MYKILQQITQLCIIKYKTFIINVDLSIFIIHFSLSQ